MKTNITLPSSDESESNETPITSGEYNDILDIQKNILEMLASQENAADILEALCLLIEKNLSNSLASIVLKNQNSGLLNVLSAPSAPKAAQEALTNLKIGPNGGSCANAIYTNEAQFVSDTFTDERWSDLRHIAKEFNICACWSTPIRDKKRNAIGSFTLSLFEHRSPSALEKKLLETAAHIVSIVLTNEENEKRIRLFSDAMKNANDGIIITNAQNKIIEVNEAFENIYGYTEKELLGENPKVLSSGRYDKNFYDEMWNQLHSTQKWSNEITNKKADGSEISLWLSITSLQDSMSGNSYYLGILTDLTELKQTQKRLEETAFIDNLTKLSNKTQLEKLLLTNKTQTLILLNVNNFSYINTSYGFDLGDKLLVKIANILKKMFTKESVFRINSDEFALLFDANTDIQAIVSRIQDHFYSTRISIEHISLNVSFSYGGAFGDEHLLRNSASALRESKKIGKNTLHIYNEENDGISKEKRESFIASNNLLYTALSKNQIIPYYQGIRNNLTGKIDKFEVLARIQNGEEIISPFRFLEPARLSGLLPEITKIMIEKSFKEMASREYTFSINITEDDLSQNYLIEFLDEKALKYNINPNRVILEILEGISAHGKESHISQLRKLKDRGYNLAVDDFGSEYSNFERVLELDIDFIKIDARYIKDIDTNPKSYEIAKAIAFFAKNANIPIIAEFVCCQSVQEVILELEIDFSQGYYFSKPAAKPCSIEEYLK